MPRTFVAIATGLVLLLAGCGEAEEWTSDDPDLASAPTPAATDPNQTSTESPEQTNGIEPSIDASVERDPVAVIQEIAVDRENPDLELVYAMLPERYQVIEFGEFWVERISMSFPTTVVLEEAHELNVESYDGYSVVSWPASSGVQWVLIEQDGRWRLDPGDVPLIMAAHHAERPGESMSIGLRPGDGVEQERDVDRDEIGIPLLSFQPIATGSDSEGMRIVMQLQKDAGRTVDSGETLDGHLLHDTVIPLDNMQWTAGDESGPVEVVWTSAALDAEALTIPGWSEEALEYFEASQPQADRRPPRIFGASFFLPGVPEDADSVELTIDGVEVGPFGEDSPIPDGEVAVHSFRYVFPNETTDPILIGEAPELGEMPEALERPEIDEGELPPIPELADLLEIESIDYDQDGDAIDTEVRVAADDVRIEPAWKVMLIWDDGVETDAMFQVDQDGVLLNGVRDEGSLDDEVVEVRFDQMIWLAGEDDEATIDQTTIQTSLGDFEIVSVRENRINMLPLGQRYVRGLSIIDAGMRIAPSGSGSGFDEDFRPQDLHIEFDQDVAELLGDEPLPASVEIWVAEPELTLSIDD